MCYKPVEIKVEKKRITPRDDGKGRYMLVPCRQCLECRQQRAKEWALRCMMEAEKYSTSSFITLTYAPPSPIRLIKKDLQDFLKRLRKAIAPIKIRYFSCGEYGEQRLRPHFHILIYGYDFPDKFLDRESESGKPIYHSEMLERVWGHGMTTVQDLTLQSAAYCALYATKPRKSYPPHLRDFPEFNTMSQGLGIDVMLAKLDTYMLTDEVWYDGKKHNIPQAVLNKRFDEFDKLVNRDYIQMKENRIAKGRANQRSILAKVKDDMYMYDQKKYRKENAQKRLTKSI